MGSEGVRETTGDEMCDMMKGGNEGDEERERRQKDKRVRWRKRE